MLIPVLRVVRVVVAVLVVAVVVIMVVVVVMLVDVRVDVIVLIASVSRARGMSARYIDGVPMKRDLLRNDGPSLDLCQSGWLHERCLTQPLHPVCNEATSLGHDHLWLDDHGPPLLHCHASSLDGTGRRIGGGASSGQGRDGRAKDRESNGRQDEGLNVDHYG